MIQEDAWCLTPRSSAIEFFMVKTSARPVESRNCGHITECHHEMTILGDAEMTTGITSVYCSFLADFDLKVEELWKRLEDDSRVTGDLALTGGALVSHLV